MSPVRHSTSDYFQRHAASRGQSSGTTYGDNFDRGPIIDRGSGNIVLIAA